MFVNIVEYNNTFFKHYMLEKYIDTNRERQRKKEKY